jgi:predicted DNA-binding protein
MVKAKPGSSHFIEKFIEKYPKKKEEIFLAIEILEELQKAEKHQQFNR